MSDGKLIRLYLDFIGANVRYCSGGLVSVEYGNGACDIYDSYRDFILEVKAILKKEGVQNDY